MANYAKKILIIEDEEFLLDIYRKKLEGLGLKVITRTDGQDCLELVKKEKIDLILLDIVLPGKDGYKILQELRADPKTASVKVMVMSNLGQKEEIDKALSLGANNYAIKANLTPKEMAEKIIKML